MAFHDAQTPEDDPYSKPTAPVPVIYFVERKIVDDDYETEYFYLCASCGPKDQNAIRLSEAEIKYAISVGYAVKCADCGDML